MLYKLLLVWMALKTIRFLAIFSVCLPKNFQYRESRQNFYVCFITYKESENFLKLYREIFGGYDKVPPILLGDPAKSLLHFA